MAKTREIKRRIKAVGNIRRITKTMQMIATARFQAAQKRAVATQPYTRKIAELVGELAQVAQTAAGGNDGTSSALSHPLLRLPDPKTNRELVLVLTSNRGLAGGYNGNILRTALSFVRERAGRETVVEVVGKKGLAFFKFNNVPVAQFHSQFSDQPTYEQVEQLADRYIAEFTDGKYDAIHVIYMAFISMARQSPKILNLLPLSNPAAESPKDSAGTNSPAAKGKAVVDYDFSPEPVTLLNELLPITVKTQLFQCFNEAVVSEQISRMVAMKAATDSAGKMSKTLSRRYNRARQAAITTELSEIIAGAASLE
ncbi:MAG: ATP synthase F1 subunit gamma [Phycisphaeraceae bacterium]|nr:ATP synthase F1 subunit gamma [Phycisphaeraceae bacterium]